LVIRRSSVTFAPEFFIGTAKSVQLLNQTFMKQDIHPKSYRMVVFKDMSNGHSFLSRSTAGSKETIKWEDGNEYQQQVQKKQSNGKTVMSIHW
jgi:hypothetical protein